MLVIIAVISLFSVIIKSIIAAIGPRIFIKVFIGEIIQYFFFIILLALLVLALGGFFAFCAYIFNISSAKWFGGIKVKLTEFSGEENEEDSDEKDEEVSEASDKSNPNISKQEPLSS